MDMLSFVVQLSLDFIFSGTGALPAAAEEVLSESFTIQLGGGTLVYPIVLSRLGVPCRLIMKESNTVQYELARTLLRQYPIAEIVTQEADGYDPVMATAVISLPTDRSFVSKNDDRAFEFEDDYLFALCKSSKIAFATAQNLDLVKRLKRNGSTIVFDVGWSEDLCMDKFRDIFKYVDYFMPNDKEAMKITGADTVTESLRILQNAVKHPVVSCGEAGCKTIIDGEIIFVPIPARVKSIDTTGAGDNFMAGFIYGLYHDMSIVDCMKFANCTGALSTTAVGCYGADYALEDVRRVFEMEDSVAIGSPPITGVTD